MSSPTQLNRLRRITNMGIVRYSIVQGIVDSVNVTSRGSDAVQKARGIHARYCEQFNLYSFRSKSEMVCIACNKRVSGL